VHVTTVAPRMGPCAFTPRPTPTTPSISPQGLTANAGAAEFTAATIVNEWSADEIADTLYHFGEETRSRQIAREIVASRPIVTTADLVQVINRITSWKQRSKTLARCFQALRICVNDEMGALDEALMSAHRCLRPGGRLVVISYHSLEDRRVKRLFKTGSVEGDGDDAAGGPWTPLFKVPPPPPCPAPHLAITSHVSMALLVPPAVPLQRAQAPTDAEIDRNRRSRSAKLRVAERYDEAASSRYSEFTAEGAGRRSLMGAKQLEKLRRRELEEKALAEEEAEAGDDDDGDGDAEEGGEGAGAAAEAPARTLGRLGRRRPRTR